MYKLLKKITLFAKEFLIKKNKKLNLLFLKIAFNPILINEKEFIEKHIFFGQFYDYYSKSALL